MTSSKVLLVLILRKMEAEEETGLTLGSTPLGRLTLHVSVYEVPTTPDPSPDTTTSGGSADTVVMFTSKKMPAYSEHRRWRCIFTRRNRSNHRTGKVYQSH